MIKTILVPATGSDLDIAVFRSALTVARAFAAHLEVLHVHVDATAVAATMASDAGVGAMAIGLVDQIEQDASRREAKARQSFQEFCARERLVLADTPIAQGAPSAQWLRQIGDQAYWVAELRSFRGETDRHVSMSRLPPGPQGAASIDEPSFIRSPHGHVGSILMLSTAEGEGGICS